MGAVCSRLNKDASKEPAAPRLPSPATAADAKAATPGESQAQGEAAGQSTAPGAQPKPQGRPIPSAMDEFKPGSGAGVYLLEFPEPQTSLVSQYAHEVPTTQGTVLLQVKAPPYSPIPKTRFVLQGGKRVLRPNIEAMKDTPGVKAKYCEVIMAFVNLASTYNGFLWASSHLDTAKQPFSIFYLERIKKAPVISDEPLPEMENSMPIGGRIVQKEIEKPAETVHLVKQGGEGEPKQEGEDTKATSEDVEGQKAPEGDGKEDKNAEAAEKAQEGEKKEEGEKADEAKEETNKEEAKQEEHIEEGLYVRFLGPDSSVGYRLLASCGIVPLPLEKAKELISEDKRVEDIEAIKTVVTKAGGFCVLQNEVAE